MMWERCAEKTKVLAARSQWAAALSGANTMTLTDVDDNLSRPERKRTCLESEHVISSAPMRELINGLEPAVSEEAKRAADSLKYRDFLTVMLILKNRDAFHDNWIYIHDRV